MTRRTERIDSLMRQTIGQILLSRLSDPRIEPAKVSVTRVEVTEDLLTAKVYVSVMGSDAEQRNVMRALQHASGRVQELMVQEIELRSTPLLEFVSDTQYKKAIETLKLIRQAMDELESKDKAQKPDGEGEDEKQGT